MSERKAAFVRNLQTVGEHKHAVGAIPMGPEESDEKRYQSKNEDATHGSKKVYDIQDDEETNKDDKYDSQDYEKDDEGEAYDTQIYEENNEDKDHNAPGTEEDDKHEVYDIEDNKENNEDEEHNEPDTKEDDDDVNYNVPVTEYNENKEYNGRNVNQHEESNEVTVSIIQNKDKNDTKVLLKVSGESHKLQAAQDASSVLSNVSEEVSTLDM